MKHKLVHKLKQCGIVVRISTQCARSAQTSLSASADTQINDESIVMSSLSENLGLMGCLASV